uniref:ATP synthase complex subunit 8 n=1 Tax=Mictyris longicarpus TaxID=516892 RepID=A0A090MFX8_9EUCA|nr:ATP synthase F0 subunit 8 [Mictyris longicarpus]CEG06217.1 ATP synthase F0 subunit 8 [Mictyris longicarpus]
MPQMAPIYWLLMFAIFLFSLVLFLMLNFYIKPFKKMDSALLSSKPVLKYWKL